MKRKHLYASFLIVWLLLLGQLARGATTITGKNLVCVGSTQAYTCSSTPSFSYKVIYNWSLRHGHGIVSMTGAVSPPTSVSWLTVGVDTLDVVIRDSTNTTVLSSAFYPVTIADAANFFLTADKITACSVYDTTLGADSRYIIDETDGCVRVCDSTTIQYVANGDATGHYQWSCSGCTLNVLAADSVCDVVWGNFPSGTLTVRDSSDAGCIHTITICVNISQRPIAAFLIDTFASPFMPPTTDTICLHDEVQFTDVSTAPDPSSPIVSWYWDFGDGTYSTVENPSHTYGAAGLVRVRLTVKNACGCGSSTYVSQIYVQPSSGPPIACPGVVCEGDTITYSTSAPCSGYNWYVNPAYGTIVSGSGSNTIRVVWIGANTNGYATVSLSVTGCAFCTEPTTVKVPVVQRDPYVWGPTNNILCAGYPYTYRLPLWPGTRYHWGAVNSPTSVLSGRTYNEVQVQFNTAGNDTLHVYWQNSLTGCGGDTIIPITVLAPDTILGPSPICESGSVTTNYTLVSGTTAVWTLVDPSGTITTSVASTYGHIFSTPGRYQLYAYTPSMCSSPTYVIDVISNGGPVDTVWGDTMVCINQFYQYVGKNNKPGFIYEWNAIGGDISTTFGDSVTVKWTATGGIGSRQLQVRRVATDTPYCEGDWRTVLIDTFVVDPHIPRTTADTLVCANGIINYTDNYNLADITKWSIVPDTLGSITAGQYSPNITVQWSNIHTTTEQVALLIAKASKCRTTKSDTIRVRIQPTPNGTISFVPDPVCHGVQVQLKVPPVSSATSYIWVFGDGTSQTTSVETVNHIYKPSSTTSTAVPILASVSFTGATTACPIIGNAFGTVNVYPGPKVHINTTDPLSYCSGASISTTFTSDTSLTTGTGTVTYQWYKNGATTGSGSNTLTATTTGTYILVISDDHCSDTSNSLVISTYTCTSCPYTPTIAVTSTECDTTTLTMTSSSTFTSSPVWNAPDASAIIYPGSPPHYVATLVYDKTGYYKVNYSVHYHNGSDDCDNQTTMVVTVPLVGRGIVSRDTCPSGAGIDTLYQFLLKDVSDVLPGWSINPSTGVSWTIEAITYGTSQSASGIKADVRLNTGTYKIWESVTVTDGGSGSRTCVFLVDIITVPLIPRNISISDAPHHLCEGLPFSYTATHSGGPVSIFTWDFGDLSGSLLANPQHTFTYKGTPPNPQTRTVNLTLTDEPGCPWAANPVQDTIYKNVMSGDVTGGSFTCAYDFVQLAYTPTSGSADTFLWSDAHVTALDSARRSANYTVWVKDINSCPLLAGPHPVMVLSPADFDIKGKTSYCYGEDISLTDYMGTDYSYSWYDVTGGGRTLQGTGPHLQVIHPAVGTLVYRLVVSVTTGLGGITCVDSAGDDTVVVHGLPAAPSFSGISALDCDPYKVEITLNSISGFTYNWSNGTTGVADTVLEGGNYRVWVTDTNGCVSYNDTAAPFSNARALAWFPTGCVTICDQPGPIAPDTLYGPPGSYTGWDWLASGTSASSGSGVVQPFGMPFNIGSYNYNLALDNGFCIDTSDLLNLTVQDCQTGCTTFLQNATLACGTYQGEYVLSVNLLAPLTPGTSYPSSLSMDIGPVIPFNYTFTGGPPPSPMTVNFIFATLQLPPPANATLKIQYDMGVGHPCLQLLNVAVPGCSWPAERLTGPHANQPVTNMQKKEGTGLLVYPNPSDKTVNVNYIYNSAPFTERSIVLYDLLGRTISNVPVYDMSGTVKIAVDNVPAGSYIVKMQEDGIILHTAHVAVTH